MEKLIENYSFDPNEWIDELKKYYNDKDLTIIGLNDSQGVNVSSKFFKPGLLDILANSLRSEKIDPVIINAFSLMMNKTEHIDYFLKANLSVEELKLMQYYSLVFAFRKVAKDFHLPEQLGDICLALKFMYPVKEKDKDIHISTSLYESEEPIVIYSSGVNNLMREVGNNPLRIKKDYNLRDKKPNYNYTLERSKDEKTLSKVIHGIEGNFENILKINPNSDIYALGCYVPKALDIEEMNVFRELILKYNELLEQTCKEYNITYINTEKIGKRYNKSKLNFHVNVEGHNMIAYEILKYMYINKIIGNYSKSELAKDNSIIHNSGSEGVTEMITKDIKDSKQKLIELLDDDTDYFFERESEIYTEHINELSVMENVYQKVKRK
jgi:hypothetical protein